MSFQYSENIFSQAINLIREINPMFLKGELNRQTIKLHETESGGSSRRNLSELPSISVSPLEHANFS